MVGTTQGRRGPSGGEVVGEVAGIASGGVLCGGTGLEL